MNCDVLIYLQHTHIYLYFTKKRVVDKYYKMMSLHLNPVSILNTNQLLIVQITLITLEEIKLLCSVLKKGYNVQIKNHLQYQNTLITSVPLPIKFKRAF